MKQYKRAIIQFLNKTLPKLPFLWLPCVVLTAVFLGIFRLTIRSVTKAVRNIRSAFSGQSVFAESLAAYPDDMSDGGTVWGKETAGGIVLDSRGSGGIEGYLSSCQIKDCYCTENIRANGYSPGGIAGAVFICDIRNCCNIGNTGTDKGSLCSDGIIGEYYARRQHALFRNRCRQ